MEEGEPVVGATTIGVALRTEAGENTALSEGEQLYNIQAWHVYHPASSQGCIP